MAKQRYRKVHSEKKVVDKHVKKIRKRDGIFIIGHLIKSELEI